jgi:hypothetical protein
VGSQVTPCRKHLADEYRDLSGYGVCKIGHPGSDRPRRLDRLKWAH